MFQVISRKRKAPNDKKKKFNFKEIVKLNVLIAFER